MKVINRKHYKKDGWIHIWKNRFQQDNGTLIFLAASTLRLTHSAFCNGLLESVDFMLLKLLSLNNFNHFSSQEILGMAKLCDRNQQQVSDLMEEFQAQSTYGWGEDKDGHFQPVWQDIMRSSSQ